MPLELSFPEGFLWGAGTAAYQIEGAWNADGRKPSIWDTFCHTPGRIVDGDTGDVACDHYNRLDEDIALMAELGLKAYRFSISWPRVVPDGTGPVNGAGLGFYDRLVDLLLEAGIEPFPTLYHWDLPQALEDLGGWPVRSTAEAFADYAGVVAAALGDRVSSWMTLNEPWVASILGYGVGIHAPGRNDMGAALDASHHLLFGHGLAVERIRGAAAGARVGIVLDADHMVPASAHPEDEAEARLRDATRNRWFLDPVSGRGYPEEAIAFYGWDGAAIQPGDLETIAAPLDQMGLNYYRRDVARAAGIDDSDRPGQPIVQGPEFTSMGWEVAPHGLTPLLVRLHADYGYQRIFVTENGAAFPDEPDADGFVCDDDRIDYLARHFGAAHAAISAGVPLAGYFVWSFMDNFEWSFGYTMRFGVVRVDYDTLRRVPKASFDWYRKVIADNGL